MKRSKMLMGIICLAVATWGCKKAADLQQSTSGGAPTVLKVNTTPHNVQVSKVAGVWQMQVDGSPFFIKGADASNKLYNSYWYNIGSYGANSIRVYSVDAHTQTILDSAQAVGLTVTLCLYAKHETDGFDYNDTAAVNQQLRDFKGWVDTYRNHPALLMWAIGNELNSGYSNLKCWDAVNAISQMIHTEDPNHPTSTILSGSSVTTINNVATRAPDLDMIGINAYGALSLVNAHIASSTLNKPYYIGEYGPRGTWELPDSSKTTFTSPAARTLIEESSTSKANDYKSGWGAYIKGEQNNGCLGGYAFILGYQTQGAVAMWYGMRTREHRAFGALEALQFEWTGSFPANRAPQLSGDLSHQIVVTGRSNHKDVELFSGNTYTATLQKASDPDSDPITYEWTVVAEGTQINQNLSVSGTFPGLSGVILSQSGNTVSFKAPATLGTYRIYGFVKDDHNHIASACLPFQVK